MTVKEAVNLFRYHQKSNLKQKSQETYKYLLGRFEQFYAKRPVESIGTDDIFQFLEEVTQKTSKSTRYLRYAQVKSFFGFLIDQCRLNMENPCNSPLVSKTFKMPKRTTRKILDKEIVEEMVYNTKSMRDRLILELMARCGLRVGELLKIKVSDISDRKITLQEPKSGKESEVAYMPEQIAKRLSEYIKEKNLTENERIFKICYSTARIIVKRLGERLNTDVSPHDLRRYSATYASRNGVPLEIVSKVFLRHQDLRTTQIYLGKVSESEAIRWMDVLHGK